MGQPIPQEEPARRVLEFCRSTEGVIWQPSLGHTAADSIYKPIRKGFDKRVELLREAQDYMKKALTGIDVKKWSGAGAPKQMFKLMSGVEVELTLGHIMELYCLTQRPQAR